MPEKQQNPVKDDIFPSQVAGREPSARQRQAPGLHKRVLSAAYSLARGVRSSKSASRVTSSRKISAPARPTTSAPPRKPREQVNPLDTRAFSHTRTRHAPSAPMAKPLKLTTTSPEIENASAHDYNDAQKEKKKPSLSPHPLVKAVAVAAVKKQRHPQQEVKEEGAEELPTSTSTSKKERMLQEVDIENVLEHDLREATPDEYYAVLKASLRRIALRCNNIPEDQIKTEDDWKNVARLLTDKLLGGWNPQLLLPPDAAAAAAPQPVVEQQDAFDDSYMEFLVSDTNRHEGQYSDGSSPLLSLNSADFDLSGDF